MLSDADIETLRKALLPLADDHVVIIGLDEGDTLILLAERPLVKQRKFRVSTPEAEYEVAFTRVL